MTIKGAIVLEQKKGENVFTLILPAGAQWSDACSSADAFFKQVMDMAKKADEQNKAKLEAETQEKSEECNPDECEQGKCQ